MYTIINIAYYEGDANEISFKTKKAMMKFLEQFEIFDVNDLEQVAKNVWDLGGWQ